MKGELVYTAVAFERKSIFALRDLSADKPANLTKYIRGSPESEPKFFSIQGNVYTVKKSGYDAVDQNNRRSLPDQSGYMDHLNFMVRKLFFDYPIYMLFARGHAFGRMKAMRFLLSIIIPDFDHTSRLKLISG